jgi:hypothetical protein
MKGKKIVPGLAAGFVIAIGTWVLSQFFKVTVPAEVAAAGTGLVSIVISLVTPDELEAE